QRSCSQRGTRSSASSIGEGQLRSFTPIWAMRRRGARGRLVTLAHTTGVWGVNAMATLAAVAAVPGRRRDTAPLGGSQRPARRHRDGDRITYLRLGTGNNVIWLPNSQVLAAAVSRQPAATQPSEPEHAGHESCLMGEGSLRRLGQVEGTKGSRDSGAGRPS